VETSDFVKHESCLCGTSSDALAVYSDGHSHCFRCNKTFNKNQQQRKARPSNMIDSGECVALEKRKISEATCRLYGYERADLDGRTVQLAPYYDQRGQLVAQQVRAPGKNFWANGDLKSAGLFGQRLFKEGGKRIVITEGEIDAMSVYEAMPRWPAVSVKSGAAGASKSVTESIEYLESFSSVIFMFDQDEEGQKAAKKCADLMSPGKASIAQLPRKDANEMLVAGETKSLVNSIFEAKNHRPDGIINGGDLWDEVTKPIETGTLYPFPALNEKTYGLRQGELVTITAGSGIGKSAFVSEIAYHLAVNEGQKVGFVALEENVGRSARRFMSINLDKPIHLPNQEVTAEELRAAFDATMGTQRVWLYDHWGSLDSENLLAKLRFMVKACGCEWLILDHLSIVVSGFDLEGDERRTLDRTMTMLRSFAEETKCGLLIVSHLRRPPGGRSHEEGLMPSLTDLRSSHSIAQLSDMVLALGRNSQSDDPEERNTTLVRILKNRFSGETGAGCALRYDTQTGRLNEADHNFDNEEF
jgi:twinkle protein